MAGREELLGLAPAGHTQLLITQGFRPLESVPALCETSVNPHRAGNARGGGALPPCSLVRSSALGLPFPQVTQWEQVTWVQVCGQALAVVPQFKALRRLPFLNGTGG